MSELRPIPLAVKSAKDRSGTISLEALQNMYASPIPGGGKGQLGLYPTPGLELWVTVGDGPIRGIHRFNAVLYVVSGDDVFTVDSSGVITNLGTVGGSGNVHMMNNNTHVGIATSSHTFAVNEDGVFQMAESNLNGATYQDGYGIFTQAGTQFMWISNTDDLLTITATDFTSADAETDLMVGCIRDHQEVFIFKEKTFEVYVNTGNAAFPFERAQVVENGCSASGSIAKADNMVFWLDHELKVRSAQGYNPQKISTPQIERQILGAADRSSAWAWTYEQDGHTFYVLTFTDLTVVYDLTTGLWHERKSENMDRWRVGKYAKFNDDRIVGDVINGKLYKLKIDNFADNGAELQRRMILPTLYADSRRFITHEFLLAIQSGVGLTAGQGSDPQLALDWSDDGGKTWSNELSRSMGKKGKYHERVSWLRLGMARERAYRLTLSDAVPLIITGAYARVEAMVS